MPEQTDTASFKTHDLWFPKIKIASREHSIARKTIKRSRRHHSRGHDMAFEGIDIIQARNEQRGRRSRSVRDPSSRIWEAMRSAYGGRRGVENTSPPLWKRGRTTRSEVPPSVGLQGLRNILSTRSETENGGLVYACTVGPNILRECSVWFPSRPKQFMKFLQRC